MSSEQMSSEQMSSEQMSSEQMSSEQISLALIMALQQLPLKWILLYQMFSELTL